MTFRTIQELETFVEKLTPRQQRRLHELQEEEMDALPIDRAELAAARKKLFASGRPWATPEQAAEILSAGPIEDDAVEKFHLRQAEALLRAAERLAAQPKRGSNRRP